MNLYTGIYKLRDCEDLILLNASVVWFRKRCLVFNLLFLSPVKVKVLKGIDFDTVDCRLHSIVCCSVKSCSAVALAIRLPSLINEALV